MMMDDMLLGGDAQALSDDDGGVVEPDAPIIPDEEAGVPLPPDLDPAIAPGEADGWSDEEKPGTPDEEADDEYDFESELGEF